MTTPDQNQTAQVAEMPDTFTSYCLGVGCMEKCKTCQHEKNWLALNDMPDALRKPMQARMERMDESYCQITSGKLYKAVKS